MPEPGWHRLVVGEGAECGRQFAVHRAAQPDGFEHRPVWFGDQPLEAVPGQLLAGVLDEVSQGSCMPGIGRRNEIEAREPDQRQMVGSSPPSMTWLVPVR